MGYETCAGQDLFIDDGIIVGRVVALNKEQVFQTLLDKIVHLVFDGQPIQLGKQTLMTTFFVEPLDSYGDSNDEGKQRSLVYYGNIKGLVAEKNRIKAVVKERGGVLYVREMNNLTTSSRVVPSTQVGRDLAAVLLILAIVLPIALIAWLVSAIANGSLFAAVGAAVGAVLWPFLDALMPCIVVCGGIYLLAKAVLR